MNVNETIGARINRRRGLMKFTYNDLNTRNRNLDPDVVKKIEEGAIPDIVQLLNIARALDCSITEFIEYSSQSDFHLAQRLETTYWDERNGYWAKNAIDILSNMSWWLILEQSGYTHPTGADTREETR